MYGNNTKLRWIQHYNSEQKILLVGEGDFSFSACLAKSFRSGINMVATSLHSQDELVRRHWSSVEHLQELKRLRCNVLYEVDVYEMMHHYTLSRMKFDVIVFNFPHAGHIYGFGERDDFMIESHKELLLSFFENARELLEEDGEVHITHREDDPYHTWGVKELAEKAGLYMKEKVVFEKNKYKGYHNKRGGGIADNKKFPIGSPFTFKFSLRKNQIGGDKIDGNISGDVARVASSLACVHATDGLFALEIHDEHGARCTVHGAPLELGIHPLSARLCDALASHFYSFMAFAICYYFLAFWFNTLFV